MDDNIEIIHGLAWYLVFVFSTVCHEGAHALAAYRLGDPTAYKGGQVSLDPWPHIKREPFGMVVVPLITLMSGNGMIGWASTPYDPDWAERYPKRSALMSLAGPLANLALVLVAAIAIRAGIYNGDFHRPEDIEYISTVVSNDGGWREGAAMMLSLLFSLNLLLFAFNLFPLPPFDGAGALGLILPESLLDRFRAATRQPGLRLVGLLVAWNIFPYIFSPLHTVALNLLYPGAHYQ
jgi:Zn-dependent protease